MDDRIDEVGGHPCDVCRLLFHDSRVKEDTRFCPMCEAWLCDHCRTHWTLRAVAAIVKAGRLLSGAEETNGSASA